MNHLFVPAYCDEYGNTLIPYIIEGVISDDGYTVTVTRPEDFRQKWPTINTIDISQYTSKDVGNLAHIMQHGPRRLTNLEVYEIMKNGPRKSVRLEFEESK